MTKAQRILFLKGCFLAWASACVGVALDAPGRVIMGIFLFGGLLLVSQALMKDWDK